MQKKLALAALALGVFMTPALAQTRNQDRTPSNEVALAGEQLSRSDCIAQFRAIDRNGDGVLSTAEADRGSRYLPTDINPQGPITMTQFMDSCLAEIPRGG